MLVNEAVCKIVLIISGSTTLSSPQLFLLSYQNFDVKFLLLPGDACVYRQASEWQKTGGV